MKICAMWRVPQPTCNTLSSVSKNTNYFLPLILTILYHNFLPIMCANEGKNVCYITSVPHNCSPHLVQCIPCPFLMMINA